MHAPGFAAHTLRTHARPPAPQARADERHCRADLPDERAARTTHATGTPQAGVDERRRRTNQSSQSAVHAARRPAHPRRVRPAACRADPDAAGRTAPPSRPTGRTRRRYNSRNRDTPGGVDERRRRTNQSSQSAVHRAARRPADPQESLGEQPPSGPPAQLDERHRRADLPDERAARTTHATGTPQEGVDERRYRTNLSSQSAVHAAHGRPTPGGLGQQPAERNYRSRVPIAKFARRPSPTGPDERHSRADLPDKRAARTRAKIAGPRR